MFKLLLKEDCRKRKAKYSGGHREVLFVLDASVPQYPDFSAVRVYTCVKGNYWHIRAKMQRNVEFFA